MFDIFPITGVIFVLIGVGYLAVRMQGDAFELAWIGDSRAYLDPSTHGRPFAGRRPVAPPRKPVPAGRVGVAR